MKKANINTESAKAENIALVVLLIIGMLSIIGIAVFAFSNINCTYNY